MSQERLHCCGPTAAASRCWKQLVVARTTATTFTALTQEEVDVTSSEWRSVWQTQFFSMSFCVCESRDGDVFLCG